MTPLGTMFPSGTATSIGSLPHTDAAAAARLVLDLHPLLPAAPQLPMLSAAEGMLAQIASGLPGVDVYASGNLRVDPTRLTVDALQDAVEAGWPTFDDGWAGLHAFLAVAAGRTTPVKIQLAGPVTVALAFAQAGMPLDDALHVASRAVHARAGALCRLVADRLPDTPVVAFLDEPGLVAFGTDRLPVE